VVFIGRSPLDPQVEAPPKPRQVLPPTVAPAEPAAATAPAARPVAPVVPVVPVLPTRPAPPPAVRLGFADGSSVELAADDPRAASLRAAADTWLAG
jgi:hypothetical protein